LALWLSLGFHALAFAQGWQEGPGFRAKPLTLPSSSQPGFTRLRPEDTGLRFTNSLPESRSLTNTIAVNGSGVAAGDVDEDGLCDLFFSGLGGGSRLYRNLGNWRFEDITDRAGIKCADLDATGAVFADINGDSHLDLLVNSIGGGTRIFLNDGRGKFRQSPQVLNAGRGGSSLALADAAGSGRLDLYIANYRAATILDAPGTRFSMKMVNGQAEVAQINGRPPTDLEWTNRFRFRTERDEQGRVRLGREELGEPDVFLRNDGQGNFAPVSWTEGSFLDEDGKPLTQPPFDWGLSVAFRDFNGDGLPDLYICNDFQSPDRFWLNDGMGRFRAAPRRSLSATSFSSMGIDVADLNRDGLYDFLVVDMLSRERRHRLTQRNSMYAAAARSVAAGEREQYPRNTLFLARGDGTYAEIAYYAGLEASEWSWSPIFLDVDLDGYEDLLIPNGFVRDNMNLDVQNQIRQATSGKQIKSAEDLSLRRMFPPLATSNLAFHNRGDLRFDEVGRAWGFDATTISQGACLADLDNDGALDVILNNLNDAAGLYRNHSSAPRVAVRLRGLAPNTRGIGARLRVAGGPVAQSQEMVCGGRYLSCDDTLRVFAAGALTNRLRIEVTWRSGKRSVVADARPNWLYEIAEAGAAEVHNPPPPRVEPIFEDVSERIGHRHQDEPFDDFDRQPLLPRRLSQLGPGVCWWDVDGDGWEDLVIGTGRGGQLACYQNDGHGGFKRLNQLPWTEVASRDQTAIVGWRAGEVLVGAANYEDGDPAGAAVRSYQFGKASATECVQAWQASVGPLAAGDYDDDGELDLFVGGRVEAGRYPVAVGSRLYHGRNGKLVLDEGNSALVGKVGLVSGAVWSDLDGDGWPELVLACEWGSIRIFHNDKGRLVNWDVPVATVGQQSPGFKLDQLTGWWNGVTTGDLDGDGRLDIIASNWGRNTRYRAGPGSPRRIYYGDFNQQGSVELVETCPDETSAQQVPDRDFDALAAGLPFLRGRFSSYAAYSRATIAEVLGDALKTAGTVEVNTLDSMVFLNRTNHFVALSLPAEAQFAPAFAVCVGDYDGDGAEDVFLSQNFFPMEPKTPRCDAGRGLWLHGDGHGGLRSASDVQTGIHVDGDQRGAALCDYDHDGRTDLVVAQNGGTTRVYHNVGARPGLRVRLLGPAGNPCGVGAVLRLQYADHLGPAREVRGGSGYWSQDGTTQVLGLVDTPVAVWVRWPGGHTTTTKVPPGTREVTVQMSGDAGPSSAK
jgi:enediyne biosynthesis protein E4